MEKEKRDICRLCLKCEGDTFSRLDEYSKENLKAVIPELNLNASAGLVICSKCKESLEESCKLKKVFSETDQFVRTQLKMKNITFKVNLNRIVNVTNEANGANSAPNTEKICRICLKNKRNCMSINTAKSERLFTTALETCLPELDVELTADPVICEVCHNMLRYAYSFKSRCLSVEDKLRRYRETTSENEVDLAKVLIFLKAETEDLLGDDNFMSGYEVLDEEGPDIFDNFPNFSASSSYEDNAKQTAGNYNIPEQSYKPYDDEGVGVGQNWKDEGNSADQNYPQSSSGKKMKKPEKLRCFNCRRYGHVAKECVQTFMAIANGTTVQTNLPQFKNPKFSHNRSWRPPPRGTCVHCGELGHANKNCTKKRVSKVRPPKPPSYNKDPEQDNEFNYTPEMVLQRIRENQARLGCPKCCYLVCNRHGQRT